MLYAAYACTYHWTSVGAAIHQQPGEWLISRVHIVLGHPEEALRHAKRCFQLAQSDKNLMEDIDIAYAYEDMARANALEGN